MPAKSSRGHARLLDVDEAAWYLAQSPRWIRSKWAARELPGVKLGRTVRFHVDDLDAYVDSHRVGGRR